MYEYLQGSLVEKNGSSLVIEVHGIGYRVTITERFFAQLPALGEQMRLYVAWVVREQSQSFYGFAEREDRDLFEKLLTFSGIGPKTALNVLGYLEIEELVRAVQHKDVAPLVKVPGIGKKTAEKLILDLKDKLPPINLSRCSLTSKRQDAFHALLHLGYSPLSAQEALTSACGSLSEETPLSALLTAALKYPRS